MTSAHGEEEWQKMFDLYVCLGSIVLRENFSLILRRHHYRWRVANDLCLALMAIEQWGFFSVPHLLWHGTSVYNSHLRGPATLTPIAERLEVELSLLVITTHCANAAVKMFETSTLRANCAFRMMHLCFWLWVEYKFINPTLNITYIPIGQALGE